MKKTFLLIFTVTLFCIGALSFAGNEEDSKDLGKQKTISSSACVFEGSYTKGKEYDMPDYIKYFKMEVVKPYTLRVTLEVPGVKDGSIYSLLMYQPGDKKYVPSADLSKEPINSVQDTWLGIHFLVLKNKNGQLGFAPVIYKTGFRGTDDFKRNVYIDIFKGFDTVLSIDGKKLGTSGNFYTFFMNTVKGSHRSKTMNSIQLDDKDQFVFDVNIQDDIAQKWFFIMATYKGDSAHENRGFRSPITTSTFDISQPCKK